MTKRKRYSGEFKSKVALAALKGEETMAQLSTRFGVHPNMIAKWKRDAVDGLAEVFASKRERKQKDSEAQIKELHAKIGELTVERDFLGQSLRTLSPARRKKIVEPGHQRLSIVRQCKLLSISRSSCYYQAKGENPLNLKLLRQIDEQFLKTPWYGSRQMSSHFRREGYEIGRKRVRRLMRKMGIVAVYQKPRTSAPNPEHKIFPYLLRNVPINRTDQVWCADITYIPMRRGFLYLVAIMDWHSRKVLAWRISNTMDSYFCVAALEEALERHGCPEIFNTDQGSQFTSMEFVRTLKEAQVRVSMDGKGRWMDNVMIERLWRSLKYECVYLHAFETGTEARQGIGTWIKYYNGRRPHSTLDGWTPDEVYRLKSPRGPGHAPDLSNPRFAA
ncbi:MAG: IS3 family transposase [Proteobacteria bacterium]|nr:IS3 family transposase [Pseudomonadota bacterium]